MNDDDTKITRLRKALKDNSKRKRSNEKSNVIYIHRGEGFAIGNNNTVNIIKSDRVINRTVIDPNGGELSPHQKQRLKGLVDGIVVEAKKTGRNTFHAGIWKRFQNRFKINTYHALPLNQYEEAKKYLRMLYGRAQKGAL